MTISEKYGLDRDTSGFGSGLINWYNRMIEKTLDELDAADVARMVRQDILKEVAMEKAIDLFINNPYDGEYADGELLALIVSQNYKTNYVNFDWCCEDDKISFSHNLKKLSL